MRDHFWNGVGLPAGQILFGRLGEENPKHLGTYRFTSTSGFSVPDAHILTPDADTQGNGENTKPTTGAYCVAAMTTDGAQCFILGFHIAAEWDEESDDPPAVGNPDDNATAGDKVYRTAGGASLILKRGGAVIIEAGPGGGMIINPVNNQLTLRSTNFGHIADGYSGRRGRLKPGKTDPKTQHQETFRNQVGPAFDRVTLSHGELAASARRELTIEEVTVLASQETALLKTRERYFKNGAWVGEGPSYKWGGTGADEKMVLGNQLVEVLNSFIDIVKQLKVMTAWGPAPLVPPTILDLEQLKSTLSDKILSTYLFLTRNPAEL